MKPHVAILFADKPEEVQSRLEVFQRGELALHPGPVRGLHQALKGAQIRVVETEHQGFTNYETFSIGIVIDHDAFQLAAWLARARACIECPDKERKFEHGAEFAAELDLADLLKEHFDNRSPDMPSPWNSLCNAALGNVDWLDLARHYISKVKEGVTV